jgi:hypothetical protein
MTMLRTITDCCTRAYTLLFLFSDAAAQVRDTATQNALRLCAGYLYAAAHML